MISKFFKRKNEPKLLNHKHLSYEKKISNAEIKFCELLYTQFEKIKIIDFVNLEQLKIESEIDILKEFYDSKNKLHSRYHLEIRKNESVNIAEQIYRVEFQEKRFDLVCYRDGHVEMLYSDDKDYIKDSLDDKLNLNSKVITNNYNFVYFVRDIIENKHLGDIFVDENFYERYLFMKQDHITILQDIFKKEVVLYSA